MPHYFRDNQDDDQTRRLLECDEPSLEQKIAAHNKAKVRDKRMKILQYFCFFSAFSCGLFTFYGLDKVTTENRILTAKKSKFTYLLLVLINT